MNEIEPLLILHLKITKKDIQKYKKNILQPNILGKLEEELIYKRIKIVEEKKDEKEANLDISHISKDSIDEPPLYIEEHNESSDTKEKTTKILKEFIQANRIKQWPSQCSIKCKWCVYLFCTPPISLPIWYIDDTFYVRDCYCSFSCARTHLWFRGDMNEYEKMNCDSLLHLLRKKMYNIPMNQQTHGIPYAPPRELLVDFGGYMNIQEFRSNTTLTEQKKYIHVLYPPIISLIPMVEEYHENMEYHDLEERYDIDALKVKQAIENVRKRKSQKKNQNNLMSFIKIS